MQFIKYSCFMLFGAMLCVTSTSSASTRLNRTSASTKEGINSKSQYFRGASRSGFINSSVYLLRREYEWILFYEPECKFCIDFAPILKKYANNTDIKVIAFTLSDFGRAAPLFINTVQIDQRTVEQFFGQGTKISTPMLFIWNKTNGHVYPVASGMHTYEELAMRMNELAPKMLKNERELQNSRIETN
jgi:thiol-disulfide isomerase/thioredoxin